MINWKLCNLVCKQTDLITIDSPFLQWLPDYASYCNKQDINKLHKQLCDKLGIPEIYPELQWCFEKKFKAIWGQAEYWTDDNQKKHWKVKYSANDWLTMGSVKRKHIVTHELCHIAVEKLHGHCPHPTDKDQEPVTDHGKHWQYMMRKCGQNPFLIRQYH